MTKHPFNYRIGLDFGYTSLGWAVIALDNDNRPCGIDDFGVRIFPSGREDKSKAPTSAVRTEKRGARNNRDRYLQRRQALLAVMIDLGLQPKDKRERQQLAQREPLALRAKGVDEALTLHELGRALFHINQRRGFKSNRIADRDETKEEQGLKLGIQQLTQSLDNANITLGQFFYDRLQKGLTTRLKADKEARWTSRQMYVDEFYAIMQTQQRHHPTILTDEVITQLHDIIFLQRQLKPQKLGFCTLIADEKRARLAYPQTQQFRIYQEVNNLEILQESDDSPKMTDEKRAKLIHALTEDFSHLRKDGFLSWSKIKTLLGEKTVKFNLENQRGPGLKADTTNRLMMQIAPDWWQSLSLSAQRQAVDIIQTAQSDNALVAQFAEHNIDTSTEVLAQLSKLKLDDGYGRVSIKAIETIMPYLQQWQIYSDACASAGINHSDGYDGTVFGAGDLPYYGELLAKHVIGGSHETKDKDNPEVYFGKINNPTVHMALNQFRLVINALVKHYGCPPREIYLEMARETTASAKRISEINRENAKNSKTNEAINDILTQLNVTKNYANRMKYKLWEDLDDDIDERRCPLSGKKITREQLFTPEIEVEHIIPFSQSYDDSRNNKMLCYQEYNRKKGDKTPYEAFGQSSEWENILARAKKMSPYAHKKGRTASGFRINKYWRFLPDARERLKGDADNFIARQLHDTQYMSRMARHYAEYVTGKYPKERRVYTIQGKFTADLRHLWGMDALIGNIVDGAFTKDRSNHHHHAIDAIIIGLSDNSAIQKLANANKTDEPLKSSEVQADIALPYTGFSVADIKARLQDLVISHKLDHKNPHKARQSGNSIGQLHEDTNYGHVHDNIYAVRKPLTAANFATHKNIDAIASTPIRETMQTLFEQYGEDKKAYAQAIEKYQDQTGTKKVRIHLPKDKLIPIHDKTGNAYRYVVGGNNFCADIWMTDKGKKAGQWQSEIIRNFDINQKHFTPQWRQDNPTACKIMRLQINDMVAIDRDGERMICRVQKMNTSGTIILRHHNDTQTDHKQEISTRASALQKYNARRLFVSPLGKIYDPGHAKRPKWQDK